MATPRALILRTAGTNCDEETRYALELAGAQAECIHINRLAAEPDPFAQSQIVVIPGGFSYGDDVGSGVVLAVELQHVLGEKLATFVARGGLLLGICNGFQVLVKTGLLPDARFTKASERTLTLTTNESHKFEARWVTLRAPKHTVCLYAEPGEMLELPVAHGEGRLIARDPSILTQLHRQGQVVYQYVRRDGGEATYPEDPNGSADHIAGLCDTTGRIFGLMPHPERHIFAHHHPRWTRERYRREGEGLRIFRRAVAACR